YTMGGGLLAAVILSMTLSPAISSAALSNVSPHEDTFLMRLVKRSYRFLLSWVLANKVVTLTLAGGFLILTS
ncbi:membrane protein, partial [mine drainage metagenome]